MIRGIFNGREARVPLVVRGPNGGEQGVAAILDTGFSGFLAVPMSVIEALGLAWRGLVPAEVGDGSFQIFDIYDGTVVWGEQNRVVAVAAADTEPLLGIGLLYGHDLNMRIVEDGLVTIEKMDP